MPVCLFQPIELRIQCVCLLQPIELKIHVCTAAVAPGIEPPNNRCSLDAVSTKGTAVA